MNIGTKLLIGGGLGFVAWQLLKPKNGQPKPLEIAIQKDKVLKAISRRLPIPRPGIAPVTRPGIVVRPVAKPMTRPGITTRPFTSGYVPAHATRPGITTRPFTSRPPQMYINR